MRGEGCPGYMLGQQSRYSLLYFFFEGSPLYSVCRGCTVIPFYLKTLFYDSLFHRYRLSVPSLKKRRERAFPFGFCLFAFAGYSAGSSPDAAKTAGFIRHSTVIHYPYGHQPWACLSWQRSVHPHTAAPAYTATWRSLCCRCCVMTGENVQYPASVSMRNRYWRTASRGTVWCRQVTTTVLRRVMHTYFS